MMLRETVANTLWPILRITSGSGQSNRTTSFQLADAAITAMPFNLLEHLKAGGKAVNEEGVVLRKISNNLIGRVDGSNYNVQATALFKGTWQPYVEPELADGWYWVEDEEGRRVIEFMCNKSVSTNYYPSQVMRHPDGTPWKITEPQ